MARRRILSIVRCTYGGKNSRFVTRGLTDANGKRIRRYFPTRAMGEEFCRVTEEILLREGREGVELTQSDRKSAHECIRKLARYGATLNEATEQFVASRTQLDRTKTVAVAVEEFLEKKLQAKGLRPRSKKDFRLILRRFAKGLAERPLCEVQARDAHNFISSGNVAARTHNCRRRILNVFFKYAVMCGYCRSNPLSLVETLKETDEEEIKVFTPAQLAALLAAADPSIVPMIALGAFAGLRTAEIDRLDWSDIRFSQGDIDVGAGGAKTRRRRLVPILPTLRAWLEPHARTEGRIVPEGARYRLDKARRTAGLLNEWTGKLTPLSNRLRHSYGTHRFPVVNNENLLAADMGNTPAKVHRFYRKVITPTQAQAWWEVLPPAKELP